MEFNGPEKAGNDSRMTKIETIALMLIMVILVPIFVVSNTNNLMSEVILIATSGFTNGVTRIMVILIATLGFTNRFTNDNADIDCNFRLHE